MIQTISVRKRRFISCGYMTSSGRMCAVAALFGAMLPMRSVAAETTLGVEAIADTFLSSDPGTGSGGAGASSDNSGYGAMMISADVANPVQGVSYPRTMYAVVAYDMAGIKAGFDAQFGAGQWDVTDVTVRFYSNFSITGVPANNAQFNVPNPGYFNLSWLSNDAWFDPSAAGATGRSRPDFTWNNRESYFNGATIETVAPDSGFYWAGGDYNGTTACGGGSFAPTQPPCFSATYSLIKTVNLLNDIKAGGYLSLLGTPADNQVVYLINQLTKPDAHPGIWVTADLKPAGGDDDSNGETPTPVWSCSDKRPLEDAIQNQWQVRAGQAVGFYVTGYDCQNRSVEIRAAGLPKTASFTQDFDDELGKQKALFNWTPSLADVGKSKSVRFKTVLKTQTGSKSSLVRQSKISVLPPLPGTDTDAAAEAVVANITVSRALYRTGNNQMDVRGRIVWQKGSTRAQRALAIARAVQVLDGDGQNLLLEVQAPLSGQWKASFALPSSMSSTPTSVSAVFRGRTSEAKALKVRP